MSLVEKFSEKIHDAVPDSAREYVAEHPQVLYAISVPLVILAFWRLMDAMELHNEVRRLVAERVAEAQQAASEALGG